MCCLDEMFLKSACQGYLCTRMSKLCVMKRLNGIKSQLWVVKETQKKKKEEGGGDLSDLVCGEEKCLVDMKMECSTTRLWGAL